MLVFASRLQDFQVQATDDKLGKVKDLYFDKDDWVIRYLVVDTQKWLPGRKVLVSPVGFDYVDFEDTTVNIFASKEQIKDSPSIHEHQPVTRKNEHMLNTYFGWPHYWSYFDNNRLWGEYPTPLLLRDEAPPQEGIQLTPEQEEEEKLHSVNDIKGDFTGYKIQATNGDIGHVADFLVDPENWELRYFVVDTKDWLPGKFVVLSTEWIKDIHWDTKKVVVDLPKEVIENGPFFTMDRPLTAMEEKMLHESYKKSPYL